MPDTDFTAAILETEVVVKDTTDGHILWSATRLPTAPGWNVGRNFLQITITPFGDF
jgi:hypothetical protein